MIILMIVIMKWPILLLTMTMTSINEMMTMTMMISNEMKKINWRIVMKWWKTMTNDQ